MRTQAQAGESPRYAQTCSRTRIQLSWRMSLARSLSPAMRRAMGRNRREQQATQASRSLWLSSSGQVLAARASASRHCKPRWTPSVDELVAERVQLGLDPVRARQGRAVMLAVARSRLPALPAREKLLLRTEVVVSATEGRIGAASRFSGGIPRKAARIERRRARAGRYDGPTPTGIATERCFRSACPRGRVFGALARAAAAGLRMARGVDAALGNGVPTHRCLPLSRTPP